MADEENIFNEGLIAFNEKRFYDAHEHWEELWINYKLKDAKFIQGLIQLAVSYFHLFNKNLNGARSMMRKSIGKIKSFGVIRGIDAIKLINQMERVYIHLNSIDDLSYFKSCYIVRIKVKL